MNVFVGVLFFVEGLDDDFDKDFDKFVNGNVSIFVLKF